MAKFTVKRAFHTGICVSDIDWTIMFFEQVLGFKLIDKGPRDTKNESFISGVPGAQVMMAYMDCMGSSLELMEFCGPDDREIYRPRMVDVGHFHIAYVVDDVDAAVAACRAFDSRVTPLSPHPMEVDQGPNKGNRIQFVVLPDGLHIEFTTRVNE